MYYYAVIRRMVFFYSTKKRVRKLQRDELHCTILTANRCIIVTIVLYYADKLQLYCNNIIYWQVSVQRYRRLSCLAIIRPFDLCAFKGFSLNIWTYMCTKFIKNCSVILMVNARTANIAPGLGTATINHIIENKQKNGKS